jgi:hypothetical protein
MGGGGEEDAKRWTHRRQTFAFLVGLSELWSMAEV